MENRTADSGVKHRKKRKLRIGWIILLILLVLVIGGWIWYGTLDNPVTLAEPVTITIAEGSGTGTISTQLSYLCPKCRYSGQTASRRIFL